MAYPENQKRFWNIFYAYSICTVIALILMWKVRGTQAMKEFAITMVAYFALWGSVNMARDYGKWRYGVNNFKSVPYKKIV